MTTDRSNETARRVTRAAKLLADNSGAVRQQQGRFEETVADCIPESRTRAPGDLDRLAATLGMATTAMVKAGRQGAAARRESGRPVRRFKLDAARRRVLEEQRLLEEVRSGRQIVLERWEDLLLELMPSGSRAGVSEMYEWIRMRASGLKHVELLALSDRSLTAARKRAADRAAAKVKSA